MEGTIEETMMFKRLKWLGHTSKMAEFRMPKHILLGRLPAKTPFTV